MPTTSPNMALTIPTVSVDAGPTWATNLNASLSLIDSHDHSTGKGVKVTPAGLNINADLSIGSHRLTSVLEMRLVTGTASNLGVSTDGTDLFFKDGGGNSVQLTRGAKVAPCLGGDYATTGVNAVLKYTQSTTLYEFFSDNGVTYAHIKAQNGTLTGTLAVTGATTLTGALSGSSATLSSTLGVTGATTLTGALTANSTTALNGDVTIATAKNIILSTGTGTQIGTATTQRMGFYGATPTTQPASSTNTTVVAAGSTTTVFTNTTFSGAVGTRGYSIGDIVAALKTLGLIASS